VLRKADVQAAGAALGVEVPAPLRTMADIRELHRPWCVAVAAGLLTEDEDAVRIRDAMVPGGTIAYTYDFGSAGSTRSRWKRRSRAITARTTRCVAFRGDSPVEYWSEEEPEEPSPFGLNEVNRRLAALGREPA
jgi:hypothetical protein